MTVTLPPTVSSHVADLSGPTHWFDFGGPADAPVLLGVHGLGGSAWNWAAIAPLLTDRWRVVALDLAGHGRTPSEGRRTTVPANRRLLDRFVREVVGEPVVLLGNSMGGAISVLQAAASPGLTRGVVLVDAALPRPLRSGIDPAVAARFAVMSLPGLGETFLRRRQRRLSAEELVRETLALCCVDPSRVPPEVVHIGIALTGERAGNRYSGRDFLQAARSLVKLLTTRRRLTDAMDAIAAPVLVIQGDRDRLVPPVVARMAAAAHPSWELEIAHDVGHVPQLEVPEWTAQAVRGWLERHDVT